MANRKVKPYGGANQYKCMWFNVRVENSDFALSGIIDGDLRWGGDFMGGLPTADGDPQRDLWGGFL